MSSWRPLNEFRDQRIGKLFWLKQAHAAGLRVPPTLWCHREDAGTGTIRRPLGSEWSGDVILRSGSPREDTSESSNAGQFHSEVVPAASSDETFRDVQQRVAAALDEGVVFIQPVVAGSRAGIAFFDAWWWERTEASGHNRDLTAGLERGEVTRGHRERGDPWSRWLDRVARVCPRFGRWDVEYVRTGADGESPWVLLQVRPASFPIAKNPTLSLANHLEILGDAPSPWIASVLSAAGREAIGFFSGVDAALKSWDEPYAISLGGRAWMNFSVFFRMMDRWGLPRTFVTEGVGGEGAGPHDDKVAWWRMLKASPRLMRLQFRSLLTVISRRRELRRLDTKIASCRSLPDFFAASVAGLGLALRVNFAINGILSGLTRVRRVLGLAGGVEVETERMMRAFDDLTRVPDAEQRHALGDWIDAYGHRGPLESDLARPRFAELEDVLFQDLRSRERRPAPPTPRRAPWVLRWLFWMDRVREEFRSDLMKRWKPLREGIRSLAADWSDPESVWRLEQGDLQAPDLEAKAREATQRPPPPSLAGVPLTAKADHLRPLLTARKGPRHVPGAGPRSAWPGIPLGPHEVTGVVRKARDVVELLRDDGALTPETILVVPALEPSWAVVFPRVRGVVAELGGELSHASILLREAGIPAVVNCRGIFDELRNGDVLTLDGPSREVRRASAAERVSVD